MKKLSLLAFLMLLFTTFTALPAKAHHQDSIDDFPTDDGSSVPAPPAPPPILFFPTPHPVPTPTDPQTVPEPSSMLALLTLGAIGAGLKARHRKTQE